MKRLPELYRGIAVCVFGLFFLLFLTGCEENSPFYNQLLHIVQEYQGGGE